MESVQIKINYIIDGDTFIGSSNGQRNYYRARWIDSPETRKKNSKIPVIPENTTHWLWAERARIYLAKLFNTCPNWTVTVVSEKLDSYQRVISDWYIGEPRLENNIQIMMCDAGMTANSLPFQQYFFPNNDLDLYIEILKASATACKTQTGFWSEPNFILPYEFKRKYKELEELSELKA